MNERERVKSKSKWAEMKRLISFSLKIINRTFEVDLTEEENLGSSKENLLKKTMLAI